MDKVCKKCGVSKPIDEFGKAKTCLDGHRGDCKKCQNKYTNQWAKDHPENRHKSAKKYRTNNPEYATRRNASNKAWYQNNKEHAYEYQKQYTKDHPDKVTANAKKMYEKHLHKYRARQAVNNEITAGRLAPIKSLACANCGNQAAHYHHYLGYEKEHWFDVIPLCRKCHKND